jgi:hypothetical protein
MNTIEAIWTIQSSLVEKDNLIKNMEERNSALTKVLATVRTNLERAIKGQAPLNQSVYDSVDLCRANFKYRTTVLGKLNRTLR